MLEWLSKTFTGIIDYYSALTGIIFFLAILKLVLPPVFYVLSWLQTRHYEKETVKRLIALGFSEDEAKKRAKNQWRPPKKKPWIVRVITKFLSKSNTPKT